jgi:hypothetical protein
MPIEHENGMACMAPVASPDFCGEQFFNERPCLEMGTHSIAEDSLENLEKHNNVRPDAAISEIEYRV